MLDQLDSKNMSLFKTLEKKRKRAFWVLTLESLFEHSWRPFFWVLLFLGLWMLNIPAFFGAIVSAFVTIIFFIGLAYFIRTDILSFRFPDKSGLDASLEKNSALPVGQISLLEDQLANPKKRSTRELWNTAQQASLSSMKTLRVPHFRSFITRKDPSALRYIAVLLFISGLMMSGPLWKNNIYAGLFPIDSGYVISEGKVTHLWIEPPDYTQIEKKHLIGEGRYDGQLDIPQGSKLRLRVHSAFNTYFPPKLVIGKNNIPMQYMEDGLYGVEADIEDGDVIKIKQLYITRASWPYKYIADSPPEIYADRHTSHAQDNSDNPGIERLDDVLPPLPSDEQEDQAKASDELKQSENQELADKDTEDPQSIVKLEAEILDNNTIRFPIIVKDDYGVKDLRAYMNIDPIVEDRPLGDPVEDIRLVMSQPNLEFKIAPIYDMTWHTWAGLPVTFTYEAIDHIGQSARLENITLVLPERTFEHPMAKSLITMRKKLAWDYKDDYSEIVSNLESLLDAPQYMQDNPVIFLSVRIAASRLKHNNKAPESERLAAAKEVINLLWYTALTIEDGNLSLAMRELRDAQRALENAMRDPNASEEEIQQLMNELKEKMGNYFAEMQREMQKRMQNGESFPEFSSEDFGDLISPESLSQMMQDIEQALRDGDQQKAEELMSQLQRMMEMMDPENGAQLPQDMQAMREGVNELQELIERQENLIEQTEKQAKNQPKRSATQNQSKQQETQKPKNNDCADGSCDQNNVGASTERSKRTLEQMMQDFGMDVIPPPPESAEGQNDEPDNSKPSDSAKNQKEKEKEKGNKQANESGKNSQQDQQASGKQPEQGKQASKGQSSDKNPSPSSDGDDVETSQNKIEQDALRYILGQLMLDTAEKIDEIPETMGQAEQEMRKSADELDENDPRASIPHQEQAVEYLKDSQENLAQQFRQRMQQMIGIGMSGGSEQKQDPLGRGYDDEDEGKGMESKVEVPDEVQKRRVDEIIRMLRERSGDRSRSQEELEYFRRLLKQF